MKKKEEVGEGLRQCLKSSILLHTHHYILNHQNLNFQNSNSRQHWGSQHELFLWVTLIFQPINLIWSLLKHVQSEDAWLWDKNKEKMSDRVVLLHQIAPVTNLTSVAATPILLLMILKLYTLNIQNFRSLLALSFLCSLQADASSLWCSSRQAFQLEQDELDHP